jgi:hypothetical protein
MVVASLPGTRVAVAAELSWPSRPAPRNGDIESTRLSISNDDALFVACLHHWKVKNWVGIAFGTTTTVGPAWLVFYERDDHPAYSDHSIKAQPWFVLLVLALIPACVMILILRRRQRPPGACLTCGYDLTGNVTGRCPECGSVAVRKQSRTEAEEPALSQGANRASGRVLRLFWRTLVTASSFLFLLSATMTALGAFARSEVSIDWPGTRLSFEYREWFFELARTDFKQSATLGYGQGSSRTAGPEWLVYYERWDHPSWEVNAIRAHSLFFLIACAAIPVCGLIASRRRRRLKIAPASQPATR